MAETKKNRIPLRRRLIQLSSALIYNANVKGFGDATIYKGPIKGVCVPGLNCYSCPGAIASCPLGSLQNALSSVTYRIPFYIFGIVILFGLFLGRVICGFLCPFGLLQELLYKLPVPKLKKNRFTRILSRLKYVILVVFVIIVPLVMGILKGVPVPAFCKLICPAGTLEGGIPLVLGNEELKSLAGVLFAWKVSILVLFLVSMTFVYRSFCRFFCPLGAIYSLFSKVSLLGIETDETKCNHCNACVHHCKMDIKKPGDSECIHCGECIGICTQRAIDYKKCTKLKKKGSKEDE